MNDNPEPISLADACDRLVTLVDQRNQLPACEYGRDRSIDKPIEALADLIVVLAKAQRLTVAPEPIEVPQ